MPTPIIHQILLGALVWTAAPLALAAEEPQAGQEATGSQARPSAGSRPVSPPGVIALPDPGGLALNVGGFRIEQSGIDVVVTLPSGLVLEPGAVVVIGRRAAQVEFEKFWQPLEPDAIYLNGAELAGAEGFPRLTGGQRFRLVAPEDDLQIDPPRGRLPSSGIRAGRFYQRASTNRVALHGSQDPTRADPGLYAGARAGTGLIVISEIADADEVAFEFIELFYDAAPAE